jgi:hypothetical protein
MSKSDKLNCVDRFNILQSFLICDNLFENKPLLPPELLRIIQHYNLLLNRNTITLIGGKNKYEEKMTDYVSQKCLTYCIDADRWSYEPNINISCKSAIKSTALSKILIDSCSGDVPNTNNNLFKRITINRHGYQIVELLNKHIIILGGWNRIIMDDDDKYVTKNTSEVLLYDPVADSFSKSKSKMIHFRHYTSNIRMQSGDVMITGGLEIYALGTTNSCEIYHHLTDEFCKVAEMCEQRVFHKSITLSDGSVMVTGGFQLNENNQNLNVTNSCEIYNPAKNCWKIVSPMLSPRSAHGIMMLPDNRVMVFGGYGNEGILCSCEIYDVENNCWSITNPMPEPRAHHHTIIN